MIIKIFKKKIKILTHDGRFHADEVFAIAALQMFFRQTGEKIKVVRSRDMEDINQFDIVLDIGHVYDHSQKKYDHHQRDGAGVRENGVPYASFGLIWKHYGGEICRSLEVSKIVDESIVQPIDACDIGYDSFKAQNKNLNSYIMDTMIKSFNPIRGRKEDSLKMFLKAVSIAFNVLEREIYKAEVKVNDIEKVKEVYEKAEDKRILIFDEFRSLGNILDDIPEPIYSISPSEKLNDWRIYAIPVLSNNSYEQRKRFPEAWGGLVDSELETVTGVSGAKFCHSGGFLCVTNSKSSAIQLAKKALKM